MVSGASRHALAAPDLAPDPALAAALDAALAQHRAGQLERAEALYRAVLASAPGRAQAWHMLGVLQCQRSRFEAGIDAFERAVAAEPAYTPAWLDLGAAHRELRNLAAALYAYDRAVQLAPDRGEGHNRRGEVLSALRRETEALAAFERALAAEPHKPAHLANVGAALLALGRPAQALPFLERALALAPAHHIAQANIGVAQQAQGRLADARTSYQRALDLAPGYVEAQWNLGLLDLLEGRYAAGWRGHEVRWQRPMNEPYRHAALPRWNAGIPLEGRRILLWAEQGLGDTLQFSRYAPWFAARGAGVVLEVQAPLLRLLRSLPGVEQVVGVGEAHGACDLQLPLMSLPAELAAQPHEVMGTPPYLCADPARAAHWARKLPRAARRPLVGLACSGNPAHRNDAQRSIPLAAFAGILSCADWVLLQPQLRRADEETLARSDIVDLRGRVEDFADTAAVLQNLDLVISVDTAVAHLAGALGIPVWILVPYMPDWRWQLGRTDSPWYPSARLFRQPAPGDWATVLAQVGRELALLAPQRAGAPGSRAEHGQQIVM